VPISTGNVPVCAPGSVGPSGRGPRRLADRPRGEGDHLALVVNAEVLIGGVLQFLRVGRCSGARVGPGRLRLKPKHG